VSHLGDRAAAFVDGQLSPDAAERATGHLAACRPCRDLVELERLTKVRLATLQGPAPTADLMGRLLAMGGPSGPLPPRPGHVPGMPRPQTVPLRTSVGAGSASGTAQRTAVRPARRPVTTRPNGRPGVLNQRRTRLAAVVLGALSVMGVGVAGVTVGAATSGAAPRQLPSRLGTVSSPVGASVLTTSVTGQGSFDWLEGTVSGSSGDSLSAGGSQRLLARR
jgi:anti-sigma factor RsiW